jgi:hypothetical protein
MVWRDPKLELFEGKKCDLLVVGENSNNNKEGFFHSSWFGGIQS